MTPWAILAMNAHVLLCSFVSTSHIPACQPLKSFLLLHHNASEASGQAKEPKAEKHACLFRELISPVPLFHSVFLAKCCSLYLAHILSIPILCLLLFEEH